MFNWYKVNESDSRADKWDGNEWNAVKFEPTHNFTDREITPDFLVIHYTAGGTLEGAVNWLTNPSALASAHVVIGLDGEVVQLVDFNKKAWHCGKSKFKLKGISYRNLNSNSIGIELVNPGPLIPDNYDNPRRFKTLYGASHPEDEVVSFYSSGSPYSYWASYSELQMDACLALCHGLVRAYPTIKTLVGHSCISPDRKIDPGPAFPIDSFRQAVFGDRYTEDEE